MLTGTCHCGATGWRYDATPPSATACNCTLCRKHGVIWAYGNEGEAVTHTGPTTVYTRTDLGTPNLEFHFCPKCGCLVSWRAINRGADGARAMAVNLRLAEPDNVGSVPVRHFDGHDAWKMRPDDGRTVGDMWF